MFCTDEHELECGSEPGWIVKKCKRCRYSHSTACNHLAIVDASTLWMKCRDCGMKWKRQ
jgi:flavoprotein